MDMCVIDATPGRRLCLIWTVFERNDLSVKILQTRRYVVIDLLKFGGLRPREVRHADYVKLGDEEQPSFDEPTQRGPDKKIRRLEENVIPWRGYQRRSPLGDVGAVATVKNDAFCDHL
jgi:hypothetical protein